MKKIAVNTVKAFLKENKKEDAYTQAFTVGGSSFEVSFHCLLYTSAKGTEQGNGAERDLWKGCSANRPRCDQTCNKTGT